MSFAYHDHAMGTAVYAGIREALDSLCTQGGPILACGRYVLEGARTMGLPVSCRRPGWQHRRLPTQPDQRRRGSQSVFPQGASYPTTRAGQYDGYAASQRAVREMPGEDEAWNHTKLRSSKYLNNLIEQDHRGIKSRTGPMLGELLRRIRKGQFASGRLRLKNQTAPAIWNAVLAA